MDRLYASFEVARGDGEDEAQCPHMVFTDVDAVGRYYDGKFGFVIPEPVTIRLPSRT